MAAQRGGQSEVGKEIFSKRINNSKKGGRGGSIVRTTKTKRSLYLLFILKSECLAQTFSDPHSLPSLEVVLAAFWRNSESMEGKETGPHEGPWKNEVVANSGFVENIEVETRFRPESRELSVPLQICSCPFPPAVSPGGWPL